MYYYLFELGNGLCGCDEYYPVSSETELTEKQLDDYLDELLGYYVESTFEPEEEYDDDDEDFDYDEADEYDAYVMVCGESSGYREVGDDEVDDWEWDTYDGV